MEEGKNKKHFILVHGACHGAWCWYKVITLLTSTGNQVTAVDLAASGINLKKLKDEHYEQTSLDLLMDCKLDLNKGQEKPSTILFGPRFLSQRCCQLSPPEDLTLAMTLIREGPTPQEELSHAPILSKERYGSVTRVYIICDEDKGISHDFQRWMIENDPVKEVKVINGSDHMPMFSKPRELCHCLLEIAETYS